MTIPSDCPDARQLAAMLHEALPSDEQSAIQEHVSACAACQDRLETLVAQAAGDELPLQALGEHQNSVFADSGASPSRGPSNAALTMTFLEPSTDPNALGRLGQYDVLEVVGRGGMGIVLKGRDTRLCRIVAIKVLAPELASNPTAHKRFLREARAAAAVSHDHVITIFAVEQGRVPFLVMEFIDGRSLQEKIDAEGYLQLEEILRIGHQIAAGLAAAHAQGLTHRDIKPTNILLQNGIQRVQITDFGLARAMDDVGMTHSGEVPGTPQFMSPEQAQGQAVDQRSDLFSLGCVLYAMCTGRSPFRAESALASLRLVCDTEPRAIRAINPDIPAWLSPIVDRLLAKDPNERYQSAGEVAELLEQHLAHLQNPRSVPQPAMARTPAAARGNGHVGRRAWLIGAIVLAAALTIFGVTEATSVTDLAGTVIRVVSGEGALIVELDDPTIKVTVDGEEVVITEAGAREVRVRPGPHKVAATKDGKPVPVSEELVTIKRGGRQVVRVTYEPPVAKAGAAEAAATAIDPPASKGLPQRPAESPFEAQEALAYQQAWARRLRVPIEHANSLKMRFRLIPPGRFVMGTPPEDLAEALRFVERVRNGPELLASESPQHEVTLSEAWLMGVHEVTQDQYEAVCGENPSYFTRERRVAIRAADPAIASAPNAAARRPRLPVDSVSWKQATEFCNRLSQLEGLPPTYAWEGTECTVTPGAGYRLPTEAEWEYACRAGTDTRYGVVDNFAVELESYAWISRNAKGGPSAIGQKRANAFGLYDMFGNVAEWCQDGWDPGYYSQLAGHEAIDPQGAVGNVTMHVLRGGDFRSGPVNVRSSARGAADPKVGVPTIGLRVVLPLAGVKTLLQARRDEVPRDEAAAPVQPPGPDPPGPDARGGLP